MLLLGLNWPDLSFVQSPNLRLETGALILSELLGQGLSLLKRSACQFQCFALFSELKDCCCPSGPCLWMLQTRFLAGSAMKPCLGRASSA